MTAQIRPTRMDVSDRFSWLGFAIRTGEPNVDAEVVLATDIDLFYPQNKSRRTAANFYSSREHGLLAVPRGEGVFIVPPEVLARFIGQDRLYFGLATGRTGNGGLSVDALPRDGSPYVSLRGFTGRTLRRSFATNRGAGPPVLEWTGDAPQPGTVPATPDAQPAVNGGPADDATPPSHYDDGFGPMPAIPARQSSYSNQQHKVIRFGRPRGRAMSRQMSGELTAEGALRWIQQKVEQVVGAVGNDVDPPYVYRLNDDSSLFRQAWNIVFSITGLGSSLGSFLAELPDLADRTGVTLSIGPGVDAPLFAAGAGVVFEPGGQVALFGAGEVTLDLSGLREFVENLRAVLQVKMKLGYNRGGINAFANIGKVGAVNAGEELVVGAEVWLDRSGSGIGGAVSIGAGFALELAADADDLEPALPGNERRRAEKIGGMFAPRVGDALDRGLDPRALQPLLDVLDPPAAQQPLAAATARGNGHGNGVYRAPPPARKTSRAMDAGASAAIAAATFVLTSLRDSQGDVHWELQQMNGIKHPNDVAPATPRPFHDGERIMLNDWPVAGGAIDDISAWFQVDWQYDGQSLGNVSISNIGTNDAVGWGLNVTARIAHDNRVFPPSNCARLKIRFDYRFDRSIGSDVLAYREVILYGDGRWEMSGDWLQASMLSASGQPRQPAYA